MKNGNNNNNNGVNHSDFSEALRTIERVQKSIAKKLQKLQEDYKEEFAKLNKRIEYSFKIIEEKAEEFSEAGWPQPQFLTPKELIDVYQDSSLDTIDEKMIVVFDEGTADFENMKNEIFNSKELEEWHPLLNECFWCYSNKKFNVTIPALLSVLEGVIAKKWDNIDGQINVHNWINSKLATNNVTFEIVYLKSISKFLKHLYKSIDFKHREHPKLNRHLILHGRSIKVWGKADSLKLFLNIYVIATVIKTKYT